MEGVGGGCCGGVEEGAPGGGKEGGKLGYKKASSSQEAQEEEVRRTLWLQRRRAPYKSCGELLDENWVVPSKSLPKPCGSKQPTVGPHLRLSRPQSR